MFVNFVYQNAAALLVKMRVLAFFYAFLFYILTQEEVMCQEISAEFSSFEEAYCQSQCLVKKNERTCNCSEDSSYYHGGFKIIKENDKLNLLCKSDNMLSFRHTGRDFSAYIFEIKEKFTDWKIVNITLNNTISIYGLKPNCTYKIRLWEVAHSGIVYGPLVSDWLWTNSKNSELLPVEKLTYDLVLSNKYYKAIFRWTPAEDMSCFYHLYYYSMNDINNYLTELEIIDPSDLTYQIESDPLNFSNNYSVTIRAKDIDDLKESNTSTIHFETPSCLDTFYNLSICPPPQPTNITVDEIVKEIVFGTNEVKRDLKITWSEPKLQPDFYLIKLLKHHQNLTVSSDELKIPGNKTAATFTDVILTTTYFITIEVHSEAGFSETFIKKSTFEHFNVPHTKKKFNEIILLIIGPLCILMVLIFVLMCCNYFTKNSKQKKRENQYFQELEQITPSFVKNNMAELHDYPLDEWEIDSKNLVLNAKLGEGAFGIVRKGWLVEGSKNTAVAIKMLKTVQNLEEVRQFHKEIEIMKSVGSHPHLVCMIGCVTRERLEGPLLVVEYCSKGDLQTYLRCAWEKITNQEVEKKINEVNAADIICENQFLNKTYVIEEDLQDMLQPKDLLSFARQIAIGMEYLSNLKVLHRDLAARNVLVCENRTVKVSDFGLSRDVYQNNIYCKVGGGKLPVRWMALESLTHQRYTIQSDVWSFGILLWEIVTLGGNPYPGIATKDLLAYLKDGYRMEQPNNCNQELYNIMTNCWKATAKDRPTFTQIRESLDTLLQDASEYLHLDINTYKNVSWLSSGKTPLEEKVLLSERYSRPSSA